jgi:DNA-binding NarL/FixJ family response regulator
MQEKKRVVIAEDHKILRQGLRSLLSTSEDLEVVGEAGDGMSAIRTIKEINPDLVLLDLNMPKMDGIAVIKEIKQRSPETKVLALTMHRKEEYVLEVFNSGGDGYCLKSSGHEDLMMAIQAVLSGKRYISPEISGLVLEGFLESRKTIKKKSSFETLTQREKEVLKLVGEGYQNKEIADYLCISAKTVEKHRANIMQKLDLHTASALTAYAIEKGLVVKE